MFIDYDTMDEDVTAVLQNIMFLLLPLVCFNFIVSLLSSVCWKIVTQ